jgi:hypothetical protein
MEVSAVAEEYIFACRSLPNEKVKARIDPGTQQHICAIDADEYITL